MLEMKCDVAVIGAGPAGLAAALSAKKTGAEKVLLIERDSSLGGILQQCIHAGFGLSYFKEELTGPEYANRFIAEVTQSGIEIMLNTMVLDVLPNEQAVICVSSSQGMTQISIKSAVLAMGCRERTRANIMIPGTRPAGVYTAGSAQRLINRQNAMVGRRVVILGSGDIGMIIARRMTLEGAQVLAVVEIMDYLAGLTRNRVQCLDDYAIPLKLSHTVTRIMGHQRVEGVYIAQVDTKKKPILETEAYIACDTLLLSVGLIPENELTRSAKIKMSTITNGPVVNQYMQTSAPMIFACGNVVHVNDLVDNVSVESMIAGRNAARYSFGTLPAVQSTVEVQKGQNIRYICPHEVNLFDPTEKVKFYFRVVEPDRDVKIIARSNGDVIASKNVKVVNPGEMESIQIGLDHIQGTDISIEVVKEAR
ncbi:MAG: FAD-dependent oxidoreductase [Bacillota bacterium]|nr:FAD-dependent oxidoreductase [Bacillota bacterium]